jgi:hypothetical protein
MQFWRWGEWCRKRSGKKEEGDAGGGSGPGGDANGGPDSRDSNNTPSNSNNTRNTVTSLRRTTSVGSRATRASLRSQGTRKPLILSEMIRDSELRTQNCHNMTEYVRRS